MKNSDICNDTEIDFFNEIDDDLLLEKIKVFTKQNGINKKIKKYTMLHACCIYKKYKCIEWLLKNGANPRIKAENKENAFTLFSIFNWFDFLTDDKIESPEKIKNILNILNIFKEKINFNEVGGDGERVGLVNLLKYSTQKYHIPSEILIFYLENTELNIEKQKHDEASFDIIEKYFDYIKRENLPIKNEVINFIINSDYKLLSNQIMDENKNYFSICHSLSFYENKYTKKAIEIFGKIERTKTIDWNSIKWKCEYHPINMAIVEKNMISFNYFYKKFESFLNKDLCLFFLEQSIRNNNKKTFEKIKNKIDLKFQDCSILLKTVCEKYNEKEKDFWTKKIIEEQKNILTHNLNEEFGIQKKEIIKHKI